MSRRLLLALTASASIHASLLYTVRLSPAPAPAHIAMHARLELERTGSDAVVGPAPSKPARAARRASSNARRVPPADPQLPPAPQKVAFEPAATPTDARPAFDLPAPDLTWYPARQLDVFPRAAATPAPAYPAQAAAEGVQGEVTLLVLIDEAGTVHEVSVVEARPEGYFEAAAVAAFEGIRFEPAMKDGRPVRSRVLIKVAFGL